LNNEHEHATDDEDHDDMLSFAGEKKDGGDIFSSKKKHGHDEGAG